MKPTIKKQLEIETMAQAVLREVRSSYTLEELKDFPTFEDFWAEVDAQNGYEDNWEQKKETWKPYYLAAFNILKYI